jgi:molybdopterin synthase catalytic subunit
MDSRTTQPAGRDEWHRLRRARHGDLVALINFSPWEDALPEFWGDAAAGGIDIFIGTTRAERNADGRELVALDYEAYPEMALSQMRELARRARERWPVVRLALLHRVGRVALGQPSVVVAVACPHRGEAFEACRWLIDTLKAEVPIWKKEVWAGGSGTWAAGSVPQAPGHGGGVG